VRIHEGVVHTWWMGRYVTLGTSIHRVILPSSLEQDTENLHNVGEVGRLYISYICSDSSRSRIDSFVASMHASTESLGAAFIRSAYYHKPMAYLVTICHTTIAGVTSLRGALQTQQVICLNHEVGDELVSTFVSYCRVPRFLL